MASFASCFLLVRCAVRRCVMAAAAVAAVSACAQTGAPQPYQFVRSAQIDDVQTMRALLAAGIDPNLTEPERGEPGLVLALREGADKVFNLLLAQPGIRLEATSTNGDTALMTAAYKRNRPAVLALLARGAQVNRPGWTPLHYAAAGGDTELVRILLERYAYIDAESPLKITPLMIAAREGKDQAVALLLSEGADASLKSAHGWTAVQFALSAERNDIADAIKVHLKARAAR